MTAVSLDPAPPIQDRSASVPVVPTRSRSVRAVLLAVTAWTAALYALTYLVVRQHYLEFPPHYDSIGLFANLFDIVNVVRRDGMAAAIPGTFNQGLSWLQPAYALALAWAPIKSPAGLVSLNFVLLLVTQATIIAYGRSFDFSALRLVVAAAIPVVPGALYAWDGGIQDLRRDVQLILLATAVLFASLTYVTAPGWRSGVALGLLVGLAQWSRDNAAAVILLVAVPAIVLAIIRSRRAGGIPWLVRIGIVPCAVFLLIAVPYLVATLPQTIERYTTSVWGVGESRVESLMAFWNMPFNVLLGGDSRISGRVRVALVTLALLVAAPAAVSILKRAHVIGIDPHRLRQPAYSILLASGAWVVAAVFFYNTLVLGYGARWHGVPFLPIMVGQVAIMIGLTGLVRHAPGTGGRLTTGIVGLGCLILLLSAPLRMILNQPKAEGLEGIAALRAATVEIGDRAAGRPVAFLAYDTLSRHHARFYATWADRPGITEFERLAVANRDPIDLDQPLRPGDQAGALQQRLDGTIRRWAAVALVYTDTARYADPREPLWPYQVGRPVVDGLLADPAWKPIARFTLRERELVLLENSTLQSATTVPLASVPPLPQAGTGVAGEGSTSPVTRGSQ